MAERLYNHIAHSKVTINDYFWSPKLRVNRHNTIPGVYEMCEKTGRIRVFKLEKSNNNYHPYFDSDFAKWIEAACYSLAATPDKSLSKIVERVVSLVVSAQQPNGYLNTYFTVKNPAYIFKDLREQHELYSAGHLMEAAVAHFYATGKRNFLEAMMKYADLISTVFGSEKGKKRGYCGHPEIELALVKLYRASGEKRFLELSRYFVDERGRKPYYFDIEARKRGENPSAYEWWTKNGYPEMQAHKPVREQKESVGHAVRAVYLYSGMADVAEETGDKALFNSCRILFDDIVNKKMYITGGIGAVKKGEAFSEAYDLPNETAYAETCAAIGFVNFAHRMLKQELDSKYSDCIERALYNGVLSGVSRDGKQFFYDNPLASSGKHHRKEWFDCSCCPPNIARLFASLGGYIYSTKGREAAVHLYIGNNAKFEIAGVSVSITQKTLYPWGNKVKISVDPEENISFAVKLRYPGWCRRMTVKVNGKKVRSAPKHGYIRIDRKWVPGDKITIVFDMPVRTVYSDPRVRQDIGRAAIMKGPVVYCFEEADNPAPIENLMLPIKNSFRIAHKPGLLGGVNIIKTPGLRIVQGKQKQLYRESAPKPESCSLTAIPYFAWDNRKAGSMAVWIKVGS